jgi:raffinose/stachyose/melibiose transport system substrate-binding protein
MVKRFLSLALALALVLSLSGAPVASAENYTIKVMTIWSDTNPADCGPLYTKILQDYCAAHPGFDYEYEYCQQFETASKLSILIASNDVPDIFIYEPGSAMNELIDNNIVVDLTKDFSKLGLKLEDVYSEATLGALHSISDYEDIYWVPNGLSVEAVWYNKTLFAKNGLEAPKTWADMEALCDKLISLGIQPFALPNDAQWPMTRWIMLYAARLAGYDAHLRAASNNGIRFDDPAFVKAAAKTQEMCKKGYFGEGFNSLTQDDAYAMFLGGKVAMLYQGSWGFANFRAANKDAGEISPDEIGYFNPGAVDGGVSPEEAAATDAVCTNMAICFGKAKFDQGTNNDFLKYFVENYGNYQVQAGLATSYNPNFLTAKYGEGDILMKDYNAILASAKHSTLWFEAKMNTEVSNVSLENAQLLGEGTMTPEDFCKELAAAVDARKK